jgi:hypothetical protein
VAPSQWCRGRSSSHVLACFAQVSKSLTSLKTKKDTNGTIMLEGDVACFNACFKMNPDEREKATLTELRFAIREARRIRKVVPPLDVMMVVCRLHIHDCVQHGKFTEAVDCLVPWTPPRGVDDDADASPGVSEAKPQFSAMLVGCCDNQELQCILAQEMLKAFYCNATSNLFAAPTEGLPGLPADFALAVVHAYVKMESVDDSEASSLLQLPGPVVAAIDDIMKSCRAIIALTNPCPGFLGTTYTDVKDVFGDDVGNPSPEQALLVLAARKNNQWKKRIVSFWSDASDDSAAAPGYQKHLKFWSTAKTFNKDDVAKVMSDIAVWSKSLRPRACDRLLETLVTVSKRLWADSGKELNEDDPVRLLVDELCKFSKDASIRSIRDMLLASSAQQARDAAIAAALEAMLNWHYDLQTVPDIVEKYEVVEDLKKPTDLITAMVNFRGFLAMTMAKLFVELKSRSPELERSFGAHLRVSSLTV